MFKPSLVGAACVALLFVWSTPAEANCLQPWCSQVGAGRGDWCKTFFVGYCDSCPNPECALDAANPCASLPDGSSCDDEDPCTANDQCQSGSCVGSIPAELCNGADDDCDGQTDEGFTLGAACTAGIGPCERSGVTVCTGDGSGTECDAVPGTPAASDALCDLIDEDCDGATDEDFVGTLESCGVGACAATGLTECVSGSVNSTCTPGTPAADDATCDGADDDCDGTTDENYAPAPTQCGVGACAAAGTSSCVSGSVQDNCTPGTPAPDDASCNAVDDDCDGTVDEDYPSGQTTCGLGECQASGTTDCVSGTVIDDCTPGNPAPDDSVCNGLDDDCDGDIDEEFSSQSVTCPAGSCSASGVTFCVNGALEDNCVLDSEVPGGCASGGANSAPVFPSVADMTVHAGELIQIRLLPSDVDADCLELSVVNLPPGATLDADTAIVTWAPTSADLGAHSVGIEASDGLASSSVGFTITVAAEDPAPERPFASDQPGHDGVCGARVPCGEVCCDAGEICLADSCTPPGPACITTFDCTDALGDGYYCEPLLDQCLPREIIGSCEQTPVTGAFNPRLEWQWSGDATDPSYNQVSMTPAVGDVDGDGEPDIVFVAMRSIGARDGVLRVLSGVDGSEIAGISASTLRFSALANLAIADTDGNGRAEIYLPTLGRRLYAFEYNPTSTQLEGFWNASVKLQSYVGNAAGISVAVADMDADGAAEVLVGIDVYDAATGTTRCTPALGGVGGNIGRHATPAVADVDNDGLMEIVTGRGIYDYLPNPALGPTQRCPILAVDGDVADGFPAVGDLDGDQTPEIVTVNRGRVHVRDSAFNLLDSLDLQGEGAGGPPTIADFVPLPEGSTGPDTREIGVANGSFYTVLTFEGSPPALAVKWAQPVHDFSSATTGSSVFDFENDGSAEVVYGDECFLYVFSGETGAELMRLNRTSVTATEMPIVADLDADGNAELIMGANDDGTRCRLRPSGEHERGLFIWGAADDNWVATRRIWNQHSYHLTNINSDGTVPQIEAQHWLSENTWRTNSEGENANLAPDLVALGLRGSLAACPATLTLTAEIANRGDRGVREGLKVSFYRGTPGGTETYLGTTATTQKLFPGSSAEVALAFAAPGSDIDAYFVRVDDVGDGSGDHAECGSEDNNVATLDHFGCGCAGGVVDVGPEQCNNLDDDCDGATDEGLTRGCESACGVGLDRCENGAYTGCSAPLPAAEICNCLDDDCDGEVDEIDGGVCEFSAIVSGHVSSLDTGVPIAGALVEVLRTDGTVLAAVITDVNGFYLQRLAEGGTFDLRASALPDFDAVTVAGRVIPSGGSLTQNFLLPDGSGPEFLSQHVRQATEDALYIYDVASSVEGQPGAFYSLIQGPTGLALADDAQGLLLWTPLDADVTAEVGDPDVIGHPVVLRVTSPSGRSSDTSFGIIVVPVNEPPQLQALADQSYTADQLLAPGSVVAVDLDAIATDEEDLPSELSWSVSNNEHIEVQVTAARELQLQVLSEACDLDETLVLTATDLGQGSQPPASSQTTLRVRVGPVAVPEKDACPEAPQSAAVIRVGPPGTPNADYETIQAAVNAVSSPLTEPTRIVVAPGLYEESVDLLLIEGSAEAPLFLESEQLGGAIIDNWIFYGPGAGPSNALRITSSKHVYVSGFVVRFARNDGVLVASSEDVTLCGLTLANNGGDGMTCQSSLRTRLQASDAYNNTRAGAHIYDDCDDTVIVGGSFNRNTENGIFIDNADRVRVDGVLANANGIDSSTNAIHGISVYQAVDAEVRFAHLANNRYNGIHVWSSPGFRAVANELDGNRFHGLAIVSTNGHVEIADNVFRNHTGSAGGSGLRFEGWPGGTVLAQGNRFIDNRIGMTAMLNGVAEVLNNFFVDNYTGLHITQNGSAVARFNTFVGEGGNSRGVDVEVTVPSSDVTDNIFVDHGAYGIIVNWSSVSGHSNDYNVFWNNSTGDVSGVGAGPNSIYADPQIDVDGYLASGSPARNAGSLPADQPELQGTTAGTENTEEQGTASIGFHPQILCSTQQPPNGRPQIVSFPETGLREGEAWRYAARATDPDGDALSYRLVGAPPALRIDRHSGLATWTPGADDAGVYDLILSVVDGRGGRAEQRFALVVSEALNASPVIYTTPNTAATEGQLFTTTVNALDPEGDALSYTAELQALAQESFSFDTNTGVLTWTPSCGAARDEPYALTMRAVDARGGVDSQSFTVQVSEACNTAPSVYTGPAPVLLEGDVKSLDIAVDDADGDAVTLRLISGPAFLGTSPPFVATPGACDALGYPHIASMDADDSRGGVALFDVEIFVEEALNCAPVFITSPPLAALEGSLFLYAAEASDNDLLGAEALSYSLTLGPAGMSVDPATGVLSWLPGAGSAGSHSVTLDVADGRGGSDQQSFVLNVAEAVNSLPVITTSCGLAVDEGAAYQCDVDATDVEDDAASLPLTFVLTRAPAGMSIGATTGLIDWVPSATDAGVHPVVVEVSDSDGDRAVQTFQLSVADTLNVAPQWQLSLPSQIPAGIPFEATLSATDADGDALSCTVLSGPATLSVSDCELQWTPTVQEAGFNDVELEVTDGRGGSDLQIVTLEVLGPPRFVSAPRVNAAVGADYAYRPDVVQPASGPLLLRLGAGPDGMGFGDSLDEIGVDGAGLRWVPRADQLGVHEVLLEAVDRFGNSDAQDFSVTVEENSAPQILQADCPATVRARRRWVCDVWVGDANTNEQLTLTASDLFGAQQITSVPLDVARVSPTPAGATQGRQFYFEPRASGDVEVELRVSDLAGETDFRVVPVVVLPDDSPNRPPVLSWPVPLLVTEAEASWETRFAARDDDGDSLTFTLAEGPEGMTLNVERGTAEFAASVEQIGVHAVVVEVDDGRGGVDTLGFDLSVVDAARPNTAPTWRSLPSSDATVGQRFEALLVASDADGDALIWRRISGPSGLVVDAHSGVLAWTPLSFQLGLHRVEVEVSDGLGGSARAEFQLRVLAPVGENNPPEFTTLPPRQVALGSSYSYDADASDPEGDAIVFSFDTGAFPAGMTVDPNTGQVDWTPGATGAYEVTLRIIDLPGDTAAQRFTIRVTDGSEQNTVPQFLAAAVPASITATESFYLQLEATDADGDQLRYAAIGAPTGLVVDPVGGLLSWTPDFTQTGPVSFDVTASDPLGASAQQTLAFTVDPAPADTTPPVVAIEIYNGSLSVGVPLGIRVLASDERALASVQADAGGVAVLLDAEGRGEYVPVDTGRLVVVATATDLEGNQSQDSVELRIVDPDDRTPPTVSISAPASGTTLATATDVVGSVQDASLFAYELRACPEEGECVVLAEGSDPLVDAVIASADPALLPEGVLTLELEAEDANMRSSVARVSVVVPPNFAPIALSEPPEGAVVGQEWVYAFRSEDPEEGTLTHSLVLGPPGMSVDPVTGRATWTPAPGELGRHQIIIRSTDDNGGDTDQSFRIDVNDVGAINDAPAFLSSPPLVAQEGETWRYAVEIDEPNGDRVFLALIDGPDEMLVHPDITAARWVPGFDDEGSHPVTLRLWDEHGGVSEQSFTISVTDSPQAPRITSVPDLVATPNVDWSYAATASGDTPITWSVSGPSGMSVDASGLVTWDVDVGSNSFADVTLTATGPGGQSDIQDFRIGLRLSGERGIPNVEVTSPADGAELIGPFDVVGTVSSNTLAGYVIELCPVRGNQVASDCIEQHRGLVPVNNGVLGSVNTTNIPKGGYRLVVRALTAANREVRDTRDVVLLSDDTLGILRLGFTDFTVVTRQASFEVQRVYDGLDLRPGDLGHGWRYEFALGHHELPQSLFDGWRSGLDMSTFFPTPTIEPVSGHPLRFFLRDGRVFQFQARAEIDPQDFTGIPGVRIWFEDTSGSGAQAFALRSNGEAYCDGCFSELYWFQTYISDGLSGKEWEPSYFQLQTAEGEGFVFRADGTPVSYQEPTGVRFTIDEGRVIQDGQPIVELTRDNDGFVTRAENLLTGEHMTYAYDARGDLVSAVADGQYEQRFQYVAGHRLVSYEDFGIRAPTRIEYDEEGRIARRVDAAGGEMEFSYDPANREVVTTDSTGASVTSRYDERGRVIEVVDPLGRLTSRTYDDRGNMLSQTNALGHTRSFLYDGLDRTTQITDELGDVQTLGYNARGLVVSGTDGEGRTWSMDTNQFGDPTVLRTPSGAVAGTISYPDANTVVRTDPTGRTQTETWDDHGRRVAQVDDEGASTGVVYDDTTGTMSLSYGEGRTATGTFEFPQRVKSLQFSDGTSFTYEHRADGMLTEVVRPDGAVYDREYNRGGRLVGTSLDGRSLTRHQYDAAGLMISTRTPGGELIRSRYDLVGRLIETQEEAGVTTFVYDAADRLTDVTTADGTRSYAYDAVGRVTQETRPDGTTVSRTYDRSGRPRTYTDEAGRMTEYVYDADGYPTQVLLPDGSAATFGFDPSWTTDDSALITSFVGPGGISWDYEHLMNGAIAKATDIEGRDTLYRFDPNSGVYEIVNALGHIWEFAEHADGAVEQRSPEGLVERWEVNAQGQLDRWVRPDGATVDYTFGATTETLSGSDGSLLEVDSTPTGAISELRGGTGGTVSFVRNSRGEATAISLADGASLDIEYGPDARLEKTTATLPDGTVGVVDYVYDSSGRLHQVTDPHGGVTTYTWDVVHRLTQVDRPNGVTTTYGYSGGDRPDFVSHTDAQGTELLRYDMTYDADRIIRVEGPNEIWDYDYDNMGRLALLERIAADGVTVESSESRVYDAAGNLSTLTRDGATTSYTYDDDDKLLTRTDAGGTTTFTYDGRGSLVSKADSSGTTTYEYDLYDKLVAVTLPGAVRYEYLYDAGGRYLGRKNPDGTELRCLPLPSAPRRFSDCAAWYGTGVGSQSFQSHGPVGALGVHDATASTWLLSGVRGDIAGAVDDTGTLTGTAEFDPWGRLTAATGSRQQHGYAGEWTDEPTGLVHLRDRWYDPDSERFLTMDQATAPEQDPRHLNRYLYALADPLNRVDPSGTTSIMDVSMTGAIQNSLQAIKGAVQVCFGKQIRTKAITIAGEWVIGKLSSQVVDALSPLSGKALRSFRESAMQEALESFFCGFFSTKGIPNLENILGGAEFEVKVSNCGRRLHPPGPKNGACKGSTATAARGAFGIDVLLDKVYPIELKKKHGVGGKRRNWNGQRGNTNKSGQLQAYCRFGARSGVLAVSYVYAKLPQPDQLAENSEKCWDCWDGKPHDKKSYGSIFTAIGVDRSSPGRKAKVYVDLPGGICGKGKPKVP